MVEGKLKLGLSRHYCCSVAQSCPILQLHGLQHARLPLVRGTNCPDLLRTGASLLGQLVKNPPEMQESSVPGSGRSAGEGIGYSLQYSWASLVAQLVNNPSAMQEVWA